jgi:outer membrane receptor protein involved in Fe transport
MLGRIFSMAAACALFAATPALANGAPHALNIRSGPLASALHDLARQTGAELLFDRELISGYHVAGVKGLFTPGAALDHLLSSTRFTARRSSSGAWIIEQRPVETSAPEPAAPEILVIGKRTQNADIRRRETDIQPYQVTTGEEIVRAHRDDIGQYFAARVPANTAVSSPSQHDLGETNSLINLRGLGSDGTLILLDGRRLPRLPQSGSESPFDFQQPDLNAIPLHAIERVETLTGTAGGIYGFGALGGVVNVILERDYRGIELHGTVGSTTRGDARRFAIEGRLGFTPNGGRTDVMVHLSRSYSDPLRVGDRDFLQNDRERSFELSPAAFSIPFFSGNSVGVVDFFSGMPLTFKPEYGGASLGSDRSYLPAGFAGAPASLVTTLQANAGRMDLSLNPAQARSELGSHPRRTSAIVNARHRFSDGVEAYADVIMLWNRGRHTSYVSDGTFFLPADSPHNPFVQAVWLTFPVPGHTLQFTRRYATSRYTAGLVADLPGRWRGTLEASIGSARLTSRHQDENYYEDPFYLFVGPPYGPELRPFGTWAEFQTAVSAYRSSTKSSFKPRNKFGAQSLRLAGPLFQTPAGQATLTLLAERRREHVPSYTGTLSAFDTETPFQFEYRIAERTDRTTSAYAELRAPILGPDSSFVPLRSFEVQLAARHDRRIAHFSENFLSLDPAERVRHVISGTNYTMGANASPSAWLSLRASYATGEQPPSLFFLVDREDQASGSFAQDPKRGNSSVGQDGPFLHKTQGSPDLRSIRATTLSVGAVVTPLGGSGPRLSLDYSRIRRTRDFMALDDTLVLSHEELWPERVTRAPLTDGDRALGYTGGRILMLDARGTNGASLFVDTLDVRGSWWTRLLGGRLDLHGAATYQVKHTQRRLFEDDVERIGYYGSPLKWRANAGADWARGGTGLGANVQYFGRYRISSAGIPAPIDEQNAEVQGSRWVPSQTYLDLYFNRRLSFGSGSRLPVATLELAVINVLDASPPREAAAVTLGPGYSRYGDARRRRVEITLSSAF